MADHEDVLYSNSSRRDDSPGDQDLRDEREGSRESDHDDRDRRRRGGEYERDLRRENRRYAPYPSRDERSSSRHGMLLISPSCAQIYPRQFFFCALDFRWEEREILKIICSYK